jgi:hypothetical protein
MPWDPLEIGTASDFPQASGSEPDTLVACVKNLQPGKNYRAVSRIHLSPSLAIVSEEPSIYEDPTESVSDSIAP